MLKVFLIDLFVDRFESEFNLNVLWAVYELQCLPNRVQNMAVTNDLQKARKSEQVHVG